MNDQEDPCFHFDILSLQRSFAFLGKKSETPTKNFLNCMQACSTAGTESAMNDCVIRKCTSITNDMGECINTQSIELEKKLDQNKRLNNLMTRSCGVDFDKGVESQDQCKNISNPEACRSDITTYWDTAIPPREYPETEISETLMQIMAMASKQSHSG